MKYEFISEEAARLYGSKLERATDGSAGFDLRLASIDPDTGTIGTGVKVAIPDGYVGLVFIRSGTGFKYGYALANAVGVIDSDYRGEIRAKISASSMVSTWEKFQVLLNDENIKSVPSYEAKVDFYRCNLKISEGERFCQLVVVPYYGLAELVESLDDTARGDGGYGSTGRN